MLDHNLGSWEPILKKETEKEYYKKLEKFVYDEYGDTMCFPLQKDIFNAFRLTQFSDVKVVIIGQDPYPSPHAQGLAFSSLSPTRPVSLKYIFAEVARDVLKISGKEDMNQAFPTNDLTSWAKQGVFLINPVLTVRSGISNSHKGKGWEDFTGRAVKALWERDERCIFLIWGRAAQAFFELHVVEKSLRTIASDKNKVFITGHPAAAAYGRDVFSGCQHFSKVNDFHAINWRTYATDN